MNPKDTATSLRWLCTNKWGDAASQVEALKLCDLLVGYPAPGVVPPTSPTSTTVPAQVPAGDLDGMRVALVVGHNSSAPGAWVTGGGLNESEFAFNNRVVDEILHAGIPGVLLKRFNRYPNPSGYTKEIRTVYGAVNDWQPDLVVELHFNGGGGNYSFMLAAENSPVGQKAAAAMQRVFHEKIGFVDKGVHARTRGERGGESLYSSKAPCVLTEPFFGDYGPHAVAIAKLGYAGLADVYRAAIIAALAVL